MNSFEEIMSLWGTVARLAADLNVPKGTVRVWKHRRSIPHHQWARLVEMADRRGYAGVTHRCLCEIAARCHQERMQESMFPHQRSEVA